jgi:hypothetical protein
MIVGLEFRKHSCISPRSLAAITKTLYFLRIYSHRFDQLELKSPKDIKTCIECFKQINLPLINPILYSALVYIDENSDLVKSFASTLNTFFSEHHETLEFFKNHLIGESEGETREAFHRFRERNHKIILAKKNHFIKENGSLFCEVCNFDFHSVYGERGANFAEVHHNIPLSQIYEVTKTKLNDLSVLCSNCHRIVHRKQPWLSTEELKIILKTEKVA